MFVVLCLVAPIIPGSSYYLPVISRGRRDIRGVALTFDDGPNPIVTSRLLDLLARYSVRATFFVTGANADSHPELIRAILAHGHTLGNHSYNHSPFLMLKGRHALRQEVESAQKLLRQFGVIPLAFRPPVGITSPALWKILQDLGMFCVNFTCRAGDMGNRRVQNLSGRILGKARPGDIILLHDVAPPGCDVDYLLGEFEAILVGLKKKGLEVQRLAQLIGKDVMHMKSSEAGTNAIKLFYDGFAATYEEEQFCSNTSISRRTELKLFALRVPEFFKSAYRVLEIGAGTGIFTTIIAKHCRQVDALDISRKMLVLLDDKCKMDGITNVRTCEADVEVFDFDGLYDVVCAFSSLAYLKDLPAFLHRLANNVQPGGTLYFITAKTSLFRFFTQIGNAMRQGLWLKAYTRREMDSMLIRAGFVTVSIESHLLKSWISGGMILEVVARKPPTVVATPVLNGT